MLTNRHRTVHASYEGMEIVRYDRAGKWFLEPTDSTSLRQAVSIRDAARQAVWGYRYGVGGCINFDRMGGSAFDRLVRKEMEKYFGAQS